MQPTPKILEVLSGQRILIYDSPYSALRCVAVFPTVIHVILESTILYHLAQSDLKLI